MCVCVCNLSLSHTHTQEKNSVKVQPGEEALTGENRGLIVHHGEVVRAGRHVEGGVQRDVVPCVTAGRVVDDVRRGAGHAKEKYAVVRRIGNVGDASNTAARARGVRFQRGASYQ
jgi:hypothetical protein